MNWALLVAKIPPERIVILGHSLGTAVAAGVVHHFATNPHRPVSLTLDEEMRRKELNEDEDIEAERRKKESVVFAGVVLVASFTHLPALLLTYRIPGLIPILAPFRPFRFMHRLVDKLIFDKWNTTKRLQCYHRAMRGTRSALMLIHALSDTNIPWTHSLDLFGDVVFADIQMGGDDEGTHDGEKRHEHMAEARKKNYPGTREWTEKDGRTIRLDVVEHGGLWFSSPRFLKTQNG